MNCRREGGGRNMMMDEWRNFFNSAKVDIFQVIEHAIMVAAFDCPKEYKLRRDRIAEILFSSRLTRCFGCHRLELALPCHGNDKEEEGVDEDHNIINNNNGDSINSTDFNKVNSSTNDDFSNIPNGDSSYDEAEALTDELEEESRIVNEVLRIREILDNSKEESVDSLFDSLRRLELMGLSMSTLEATHIGKVVNRLKKHRSPQIHQLARTLVDGWKGLYRDYYTAKEVVKGKSDSPDSVNPPTVNEGEEEGLPSPPLEDFGAILNVQTSSLELSKFFEGMDEDGNPRSHGEFDRGHGNVRKPVPVKSNIENENKHTEKRKLQSGRMETLSTKDKTSHQIAKEDMPIKQSKLSNPTSGLRRPQRLGLEMKLNSENTVKIQKRPGHQDRLKCPGEALDQKLAASKRKLHENYQQAINAKKQRTVQVMELSDIPRNGFGSRNAHFRPGNYNRQRPNGRR